MTSANHVCLLCMRETPLPLQRPCPFCGGDDSTLPIQSPALPPRTVLDQRYVVGRTLGQGGFGITYQAYDLRMGNTTAIKEYFPSSLVGRDSTVSTAVTLNAIKGRATDDYASGLRHFLYEARRQAKLASSPGVVSVTDFFEENNTAYYIMEYVDGCTLVQHLKKPISIGETLTLLEPIADSLISIHAAGLIHRDISPDNIMCAQNGQRKLLDFGASHSLTGEESTTGHAALKHGFAPPEQYGTSSMQGAWTDIYAFCATIYWCLTGKIPQDSMDRSIGGDRLRPPSELGADIMTKAEAVLMRGLALPVTARYQDMETFWKRLKKAAAGDEAIRAAHLAAAEGETPVERKPESVPSDGGMDTPERTKVPVGKPSKSVTSRVPQSGIPARLLVDIPDQIKPAEADTLDDDVKIAAPIRKRPRSISVETETGEVPDITMFTARGVLQEQEPPTQPSISVPVTPEKPTEQGGTRSIQVSNRLLWVVLCVLVMVLGVLGFMMLRPKTEPVPDTSVEEQVVTINGVSYPVTTTELYLTADTNYAARYRSHVTFEEVPYLSASDWNAICQMTELKKLYLVGINLTSLSGIEVLQSLEILDVSKNHLTDLEPVAQLHTLKELYAADNDLTSCPAVEGLAYLDLSGNLIEDISCLSGFNTLTTLYLQRNKISNLEPLRKLTSLSTLDIAKNRVTTLSSLSDMESLRLLYVDGNAISNMQLVSFRSRFPDCALDVDVLTDIPDEVEIGGKKYSTQTTGLNLASSGLENEDIENLKYMIHLSKLDLSGNQLTDCSVLSRLYSLTSLSLSYNDISNIDFLSGLTSLNTLYLSSNEIADLTPLENLVHLESLSIGNNLFADLTPLSGLTQLKMLAMCSCQAQNLEALYPLTNLQELRVSRSYYSDQQLADVRAAIPACKINQY